MKTLLSSIATVSMMLVSLHASSMSGLNGLSTNHFSINGLGINGVDSTVNLRGLAQAPLVKAD